MEQRNMEMKKMADDFVGAMRAKGIKNDVILSRIQQDIEYGISKEQVHEYLKKFKDENAIIVYSKCLRAGYSKEAIDIITNPKMNWQQMETAFEFYERRVPLETVKKVIDDDVPAKRMRDSLLECVREIENQRDKIPADYEYVTELLADVQKTLSSVTDDKSNYEKLAEKIDLIITAKKDDVVEKNLIRENELLNKEKVELESQLSGKQDLINQGLKTISELRNELINKKEEVRTLGEKLSVAETKLSETSKREDSTTSTFVQESLTKESVTEKAIEINRASVTNAVPVYVQVPIMNRGLMVEQVLVDNTKKKTSGVVAILGKLCFKKKSKRDILRLVASGDLSVEQLEQVCVGIESGLDEMQLEQLINNKLEPDRMAKIISIAVMDNEFNEDN